MFTRLGGMNTFCSSAMAVLAGALHDHPPIVSVEVRGSEHAELNCQGAKSEME